MGSDVMRVRLGLRQVRVLGVVLDTPFELVVEVESSVRRPRCPDCGSGCAGVHDVRVKRVRDLEVSGRPAVLLWRRRRLVCGDCGRRFLERHPAFEGGVTARLARRLVADARAMPISRVARRHGVGWHQVNGLVRAWSELVAERRRSRRCRVLLVDETSIRKRHRPLEDVVRPAKLAVLLAQPPQLPALRRGHPRTVARVDLGLTHPFAHRLHAVAQLTRHTRHRPSRGAQLSAQRHHHPHRLLFLPRRIPPRRRRQTKLCIHGSHACSNL